MLLFEENPFTICLLASQRFHMNAQIYIVILYFVFQLVLYTFRSSESLHSFVSQNITQVWIRTFEKQTGFCASINLSFLERVCTWTGENGDF